MKTSYKVTVLAILLAIFAIIAVIGVGVIRSNSGRH